MAIEFKIAKDERAKGHFIRQLFATLPELPSIGVVAAGGMKYSYPGKIIDLMGLNNLLMAHNSGSRIGTKNHAAFEKATFYQLQPDILMPDMITVESLPHKTSELHAPIPALTILKDCIVMPRFRTLYVYARINKKEIPMNVELVGWIKRTFLARLGASGCFDIDSCE